MAFRVSSFIVEVASFPVASAYLVAFTSSRLLVGLVGQEACLVTLFASTVVIASFTFTSIASVTSLLDQIYSNQPCI